MNYSKNNSINDGVLICVDESKDIYKYVPLEQVMLNGISVQNHIKNYELQINKLTKRIEVLEQNLKLASTVIIDNAGQGGEE